LEELVVVADVMSGLIFVTGGGEGVWGRFVTKMGDALVVGGVAILGVGLGELWKEPARYVGE